MTDSMKFGPEWLRNMSADSTNPGQGGGLGTNSSNSNSSNPNSTSVNHHNSSSGNHIIAPRNMFPEFRYGREEMLSLFHKNCIMPELLPSYKKIFVEKVQYPLALTPSTDEEMLSQSSSVPTQRPTWMQRSPVGFTNSTRGTGRGGSVDRGRMRGKSVYHAIYQRPTAMFEDDIRSPSLKPERSWSERNGTAEAVGGGSGSVGLGSEWSGTPASSPRKEFSSHPRNMENWRRNRNEDSLAEAPSGGPAGSEGWRGASSTNFGSSHRWGRSTSWRDDDISPANVDGNYGGLVMQRSYSTISTTVSERGGYVNNSVSKISPNSISYASGGQPTIRTLNSITGSSSQSSRNSQWTSSSSSAGGGGEGDDNLPEWAMETPSDGGGTFDASGAFHGSVDEDEVRDGHRNEQNIQLKNGSTLSKDILKNSIEDIKAKIENTPNDENSSAGTLKSNASSEFADAISTKINTEKHRPPSFSDINIELTKKQSINKESQLQKQENEFQQNSKILIDTNADVTKGTITAGSANKSTLYFNTSLPPTQEPLNSDFSDRMKKVADDMVEKLIMDDDTVGMHENNISSNPLNANSTQAATAGIGAQNAFVSPSMAALIKHTAATHHAGSNAVSISPTLPTIDGNHKVVSLYGGGMIVDHATMQQHQLQQQQLSTVASAGGLSHALNASSSSDFWFYRDPQSKVQGPFTAIEMTEWYRAGYFNENLFVRRVCDTRFRALGELIKLCHGNMPFTHSHLVPISLENINMPNAAPLPQMHEKAQVGNDLRLKLENEQSEELKENVTAAADTLSLAVKNLISSVDVSHMLNMHFQMLQEQYIRHQEIIIISELSKNECFQRLTPSDRDAIVRQKVQMLGLPEYLTSLSGLSNSLAALNPTAGNQLYDAIAECSKKDPIFSGGAQHHQQQQQKNTVNAFLDTDDFILNGQPQQHQVQFSTGTYGPVLGASSSENIAGDKIVCDNDDLSGSELLSEYNLRMFLRNTNTNSQQTLQQRPPKFLSNATCSNDFLAETQMLSATASQSPIMQMWLPQLGATMNTSQQMTTQSHQKQPQLQNHQWAGGPLVGIPSSVLTSAHVGNGNIRQQLKSVPNSMWEVDPLNQEQRQPQSEQSIHFDSNKKKTILIQHAQPKEHQQLLAQKKTRKEANNFCDLPNQTITETAAILELQSSSAVVTNQQKDEQFEKQQTFNSKRSNNKQQSSVSKPFKDEIINKKNDEDRRRDLAEEKRRQKEERKRQQVEDEKRRCSQVEEEKRRQMLEEKERQHQIQAQRRKAMLGTANASVPATNIIVNSAVTIDVAANKSSKEQQRTQSSVAPWSTQTTTGKNGPCLAEIQKAERRERRADQQRQMEMLEKQMRVNNAPIEANDAILKWNASPVPVKSFVEIQAEEAKRLAAEQLETQRRKEQEQQSNVTTASLGSGVNSVGGGIGSANVPSIWGGNKVWGSTSTAGFWEEPIKFGGTVSASNSNITVAAIVASGLGNGSDTGKSSQSSSHHKLSSTAAGQVLHSSTRNLRKSQTVSIMQNTTSATAKNLKINNQSFSNNTSKQAHKINQKAENDKKSIVKNINNSTNINNPSVNKHDDFENEFTGWCTKSLSNMNTKVDVPTFVTFLQDLESPYEVKDYVRMYLGESKEYTEFAKHFLERRSKYKNLQRARNAHNDDMCKPAPAITPSGNENSESKGKPKKIKKNKMTKLDARILGFSVTAAEGRINVGDRDYVDAP